MPVFILIFALLALKYAKFIRKHFTYIAIGATVLSAVMFFTQNMSLPTNSGELGIALFILVMFQSAFKKGSLLNKQLLLVRKEYSILGFIFVLPHGLLYMFGSMQYLEWNGILSMAIMVPLFITSFIVVRKKLTPKHWKTLHLASYAAYALMFAHVIYVGSTDTQIVYGGIAVVYMVLKINNTGFVKLNKPIFRHSALVLLLALVAINVYVLSSPSNTASNRDSAEVSEGVEGTELSLADGVYSGEADGFRGLTVKVDVTVEDNAITDIDVIDHGATSSRKGIDFSGAVDTVADEILRRQSLDVDTVSGATISTTGLINAVTSAVSDAAESMDAAASNTETQAN